MVTKCRSLEVTQAEHSHLRVLTTHFGNILAGF